MLVFNDKFIDKLSIEIDAVFPYYKRLIDVIREFIVQESTSGYAWKNYCAEAGLRMLFGDQPKFTTSVVPSCSTEWYRAVPSITEPQYRAKG